MVATSPSRYASFVLRRRRWIYLAWAVLVLVGGVASGTVGKRSEPFAPNPALESSKVTAAVDAVGATRDGVITVVQAAPSDTQVGQQVKDTAAKVKATPGVTQVFDYYDLPTEQLKATDNSSTIFIALVDPHLTKTEREKLALDLRSTIRSGVTAAPVAVGGPLLVDEEQKEINDSDLKVIEGISLPVTLVIMAVVFGGIIAASLPLSVAIAAMLSAMLVLLGYSQFAPISVYDQNILSLLGIGLGIDYGLLLVNRFKEELARDPDPDIAVANTISTAGRTVVFSALTVMIAVCGLLIVDDPVIRSFGATAAGVVAFAALAALTLLPALMRSAAKRIKPAKLAGVNTHGYFYRVSRMVQRRPLVVTAVFVGVLLLTAAPFLHARFEFFNARFLPNGAPTKTVALAVEQGYPSLPVEPTVVVASVKAGTPDSDAYIAYLKGLPGVASVATRPVAPDAAVTVIDITPAGTPQSETSLQVVRAVRTDAASRAFVVQVGGPAAGLVDFTQSITSRLPWALALVGIATFVLLFLMTGSVVVPIKAIIMNLLSLCATFGALAWVFQDGHGDWLLGFTPTNSLDVFNPVIILVLGFGLSMDYEVFLLSRIKEAHDNGASNDESVAIGLQRSGRIITSAAALIVVVFAGAAFGRAVGMKQFGLGLALAVIVDATIIRTILVPSTMTLLGEWNWWAPKPLRRIHERFGISEHATGDHPAASEHADDVDLATDEASSVDA